MCWMRVVLLYNEGKDSKDMWPLWWGIFYGKVDIDLIKFSWKIQDIYKLNKTMAFSRTIGWNVCFQQMAKENSTKDIETWQSNCENSQLTCFQYIINILIKKYIINIDLNKHG